MKKTSVSIQFDDEKLSALKMYLQQKDLTVESELEKALDNLYAKTVPMGVREFLGMRSGTTAKPSEKKRKPAPSAAASSIHDGSGGT